jgi:deoxyribonuclease-4
MMHFATAGVPITSKKRDTISGILRIKELGLTAMEMEFVQGVKMSEETAKEVKKASEENKIDLTVHGPYYINLATEEPDKLKASHRHILSSAKIGSIAGAKSVTFHPAFIQANHREEVGNRVKKAMNDILKECKEKGYDIRISPELTGKESQFGRLNELVPLCKEVKDLYFCYDFAHNYARSVGKNNTEKEIDESLKYIRDELGQGFLNNMHIHISNIEYSEKGERHHLPFLKDVEDYVKAGVIKRTANKEFLEEYMKEFYKGDKKVWNDKFDYKMILKKLKEYGVGGYLVCESPVMEFDAVLIQDLYSKL